MTELRTDSILKVNIAITDMEKAIQYILDHLTQAKGKYVCFGNVHTTVTAFENPDYLEVQNGAFMICPDGKPLSVVLKRKGQKEAQKVSGPDYMLEMIGRFSGTHFFYGSTEETLEKLCGKLSEKYPDIQIAGTYSPPFRPLSEEEDEQVVQMINQSGADMLWVGLGAPKQEIWMAQHQDKIHAVMFGVGAAFDFHAGTIKRAPLWMQKSGLEWLFRIGQDPKRLWKRYFVTNTKFLWYLTTGRGMKNE